MCGRLVGGGVTRAADLLIALIFVYMCENVCICVYVCKCVYVCRYVYMRVFVYMCVYLCDMCSRSGGCVTRAADWRGEV